jgi:hypothetical protein
MNLAKNEAADSSETINGDFYRHITRDLCLKMRGEGSKCADMAMYQYANMPICRCADVPMCQCANGYISFNDFGCFSFG